MSRQVASTLSMLPVNEMVNLARIDALVEDDMLRPPDGADIMLQRLADALVALLPASGLLRSS